MSEKEISIFKGIKLGFTLLSKKEKKNIIILSFLVSFFSFFEIIALMSLMPLISIIIGGENIKFINFYINLSEIINLPIDFINLGKKKLTLIIACFSVLLLTISSITGIISQFLILKFSAKASVRLADDMIELVFNANMNWFSNKFFNFNANILWRHNVMGK